VARKAKARPSRALYEERARKLKAIGAPLSFKLGRKGNSPQARAAVTRQWVKYRSRLNPRKGTTPSKFVPATKKELRTIRKFYSPEAITKKGFFIQPPKGVRAADYKVTVRGDTLHVKSPRKKVFDEVIALKTKGFLRNPEKALAATLPGKKNVKGLQILVNGFQGKNTYSVKELNLYLKHRLIPNLREEFEESGHRLTAQAVSDTFQLKILHGPRPKNRRR
jgi:hypothetical protein